MQGNPHVRFDEQGVETDRLASPTGELHDTAPPPDSTGMLNGSDSAAISELVRVEAGGAHLAAMASGCRLI